MYEYTCSSCDHKHSAGDFVRANGTNTWRCNKCDAWNEHEQELFPTGSMKDNKVKNPKSKHYELWEDYETIDAIKELLTPEEYQGFLKGNMLKYRLRAGKKDDTLADIEKALDYERELKGE